jgi:NADPH:quinone reductase-like Zn-dependent oxidoreductase
MKKIVIDKAGNYDRLQLKEFPDLKPGPGEILIETRAIGVNFADCCVRMGVYSSAKEFIGWPITPGFEVSGVVQAVGEGVTRFKPGQNVIAVTFFGGYSTHVAVREELAFALPPTMTYEEGASIPAIFLTAYYALFELAHPHPGDTILVHSAAGGVGSTLVQLGKQAGCKVVGVVGSSHKVDAVKQLGADLVIDKSKADLWKEAKKFAPNGYDVVLDANGIETLSESYNHLSAGGKLIVYGFHTMFSKGRGKPNWIKMAWDYFRTPRFNPLNMTNENHSVMAFNLSYLFNKSHFLSEAMHTILRSLEEKRIAPPPITTFPLEKAADAHRALESGQSVGKLILLP